MKTGLLNRVIGICGLNIEISLFLFVLVNFYIRKINDFTIRCYMEFIQHFASANYYHTTSRGAEDKQIIASLSRSYMI